jgi:pimeloyl-ACP methyl ester carboxylesterase
MNIPLAPLGVVPRFVTWRGHQIALHEAGHGPVVLLVHSINAAASCYEMRAPFRLLASQYRVVAIDLLGFGDSDRPQMYYTAELYSALIGDIAQMLGGNVHLVAVSLSSAYAFTAAAQQPTAIQTVTVVCPTGIQDLVEPQPVGRLYRTFASGFGGLLFAGLVSRASLGYFLRSMAYVDPAACDTAMIDACWRSGQRPGARWAPICFVSGLLNCDVRAVLPLVQQPVLIVWGDGAMTTPVSRMPQFVAALPQAQTAVFTAGMAVQDECPTQFSAAVLQFWQTVGAPKESSLG